MVEAPIFHVNGDDPEAVMHATKVATEFRQKFGRTSSSTFSLLSPLRCNEGDEPMFTNPAMYKTIKTHKTTLQLYTERLVKDGLIQEGEIEDMKAAPSPAERRIRDRQELQAEQGRLALDGPLVASRPGGGGVFARQDGNHQEGLAEIGAALTRVPEGFDIHKTVSRQLEAKAQMFKTGAGFDWATARRSPSARSPARDPGSPFGPGLHPRHLQWRHSAFVDQMTEERHYP